MSWSTPGLPGTGPFYPTGPSIPSDPVIIEHGRIVDVLCEGEIEGLSTGDLRSVFLDDTQVANDDGTANFRDVYLAMVYGANAQPAIKGLTDQESETPVQAKVTVAAPVVATISDPKATACRVKVSVPALYYLSGGTSIAFAIETNNGGGWVRKVHPPVNGITATLAVDGTAKTITRTGGDFVADGFVVGMTIISYGFSNPGNNQSALVITGVSTTVLTFANATGLVTEAAAAGRVLTGSTVDGSLKGRFTSKYIKAFRVALDGTGPWQVRLVRITADSGDPTTLQNDLYFESITSLTEARLRMPNTAVAALSVDAKQFSRIPKRSYKLKLARVQVPQNYDPIARTYATTGPGTTGGVWDGTFKTAWSDNPAWCFYDLATKTRYGAGASLGASQVNKWLLYVIGQSCDVLVDDGQGGQEPRFRCNVLINSRQEGIKLLGYLASVFRGMAYWAAGTVVPIQDVDASPAALFTVANVKDGKFTYSGTARRARHTAAVVYWNDPSNKYKRTPEYVEDQAGIARYGLNVVEVTAFACTSQGQARRLGLWTLASELTETETVNFTTAMEGIVVRPGEIALVHDRFRGGTRAGGRIVASTTSSVTLDAPVTIKAGVAYQIAAALPDGTVETRVVSNTAGAHGVLSVTAPFSTAPQVQGQWAVTAGDGTMKATPYRIISIREAGGEYEVAALLHNASKYSAIETGLVVTPGTPPDAVAFPPVLNLAAGETLKTVGTALQLALVATWSPREDAIGYSAFVSQNSGPWTPMVIAGCTAEATGIQTGSYVVRVVAHYASGVSPMAEAPCTVTGSSALAQAITGLTVVWAAGQANLQWSPISLQGLDYEIRLGSSWDTAKVVGRTAETWFEAISDGTYWVAARFLNSYGTPSSVVVTGSTTVRNVVVTWSESGTSWPGTFSGSAINSSGQATLSAGNSSGYYEVPAGHIVDLGVAQVCTLSYTLTATASAINNLVSSWSSVAAQASIAGAMAGKADASVELAISQDGTNWGSWAPLVPGKQYSGRKFKARLKLTSSDANAAPFVSAFVWTVDMPDRTEKATTTTGTGAATAITFTTAFQAAPNLQFSILNAVAGDDVLVTVAPTTTGFSFEVRNGGSRVARNVAWLATGY